MSTFDVLFTDRSRVLVEANNERHAMWVAERAHPNHLSFAAKPRGCTGLAWNVHFGAENACPVHRRPMDPCSHDTSSHLTGALCPVCAEERSRVA